MTTDEKLKMLGFELVRTEPRAGYAVYENEQDDQRVEISLAGNRPIIYSETISEERDYYGHPYHSPMGMTEEEFRAFLDKIDELNDMRID